MIGNRDQRARMDGRTAVASVLVVVVLAATVTAPVAAVADREDNETSVGAGEHVVAGVAGERAAVDGAVERRRFELEIRTAESDRARATVVSSYMTVSRERLDALERREAALDAAVENGSMAPGERAARTAQLGGQATGISRLATVLEETSAALPRDVRRDAGVRLSDVRQLRKDATALAERTRGLGTANGAAYATVARMVSAYNDRGDPEGLFADQLRDERVNLYVESATGTAVVSFRVTEDDRLTGLRAGTRGDATVRLDTDSRTVVQVADANDPAAALRDAVDADRVTVSGIGPLDQLKWSLVDLLSRLRDLV